MFCRKRKENAVTAGVVRCVGKGNCSTVAQCEHALWCTCRPSQQGSAGCCFSKQPRRQLHARCRTSRTICCLTWPNLWHVEMILNGGMVSGWGNMLHPWHLRLISDWVTFLSVPKRLILLLVGETFRDFFILYLKRYRPSLNRFWIWIQGFRVQSSRGTLIFGTSNWQMWKKVWNAKCPVNAKQAE